MPTFKTKTQLTIDLIKSLAISIIIVLIGGFILSRILGNTFTQYILSNYGEITQGFVTSVSEDVTEKDGGGVTYTF